MHSCSCRFPASCGGRSGHRAMSCVWNHPWCWIRSCRSVMSCPRDNARSGRNRADRSRDCIAWDYPNPSKRHPPIDHRRRDKDRRRNINRRVYDNRGSRNKYRLRYRYFPSDHNRFLGDDRLFLHNDLWRRHRRQTHYPPRHIDRAACHGLKVVYRTFKQPFQLLMVLNH